VGGEGDDQLWGSGRGAIAGCQCRVCAMVGVEGNDLTQKIVFCYLGSMLVYNFFWLRGTN